MTVDELSAVTGAYGDRQLCLRDSLECSEHVCGIPGCQETTCQHNPAAGRCEKQFCFDRKYDHCVGCGPSCTTTCERDDDPMPMFTYCLVLMTVGWDEQTGCYGPCSNFSAGLCPQEDCKTGQMGP